MQTIKIKDVEFNVVAHKYAAEYFENKEMYVKWTSNGAFYFIIDGKQVWVNPDDMERLLKEELLSDAVKLVYDKGIVYTVYNKETERESKILCLLEHKIN